MHPNNIIWLMQFLQCATLKLRRSVHNCHEMRAIPKDLHITIINNGCGVIIVLL